MFVYDYVYVYERLVASGGWRVAGIRECEGERERAFPGGRGQVKGGIPPPALNLPSTISSPLVGFSSFGLESAYLDLLMNGI